MRNAFIKKITELAEKDERIVLLVGDLGYKIFDDFKEKFSDRFYNVGIAEANMVSMAAGMAANGMKPFVYSIVPFVTLRCAEQIRNDLGYNNKNVVVVGAGGGLTYGHNGPTHHGIEDIAVIRSMPNMQVVCPGDPYETERVVELLVEQSGPAYLRIGRAGEPKVHKTELDFGWGESISFGIGDNLTIFSTGNMLDTAIRVQKILRAKDIDCGVVSMPFVKPLDVNYIDFVSKQTRNIVTLEEHNILGGFGSAVAEHVADNYNWNNWQLFGVRRLGINDEYVDVSGDQEFLRKRYELDVDSLAKQIERFARWG